MKKTIFITGASRGIGAAIALHFAALGHNIAINASKSKTALDDVAAQISALGGSPLVLFGNVADYDTVQDFFKEITSRFSKIDVLINNAAVSHIGFFADMQKNQWQRLLDVNLGGVINCCHAAVPLMLGAGAGNIINISSVWGQVGASCEAVYSMTKGGVNAFTRALAKELGGCGIRVNAIACGVINTQMNNGLDADEIAALVEQIPLKRQGQPQEVAQVVEFLLKAEYMTGQILTLDGGMV